MNVLTYAVDSPGETTQDRVQSLTDYLRIITDIESDARKKAQETRLELMKLKAPVAFCDDDDL